MNAIDHLASVFLERLAWTSLQAVVLVAVVALLIRVFPRLPAAARCALWWLVGAQVLLGLCWQTPIRLPLLAPASTVSMAAPATRQDNAPAYPLGAMTHAARATAVVVSAPAASTPTDTASSWLATHWRTALFALWLTLLLAQLPALLRQRQAARRLRRNARPTTRTDLQTRCKQQAHALGLRRSPALLDSPDIDSPQVSGHRQPVVLWPHRATLDARESTLALAHELAHLKRGDLVLGWVPALAARLFFFHPLLRWAMREYAIHREAACDALALTQTDVAPRDYGQLLLRLGVGHPLHAGLAGASPTFHNLKRRLTMLQQTSAAMPRSRGWLLVVLVALIGVLPYRVVADAAQPPTAGSTAGTYLPAIPPPPVPPAPPAPLAPPAPNMAPPPPPPPPTPFAFASHHMVISTHGDTGHAFALIDGDTTTVNGTDDDLATVRRLRKSGEPLLWFRRGGQSWVIHDRSYIQRAETIYAPVTALGKEQGELGRQQGALGAQQGQLGSQQGRLGSQQGEFGARMAALAAQQASLANRIAALDSQASSNRASAAARKTVAAESSKLSAELTALQAQQTSLGKRQAALGERQAALSKQQEALGERQAALSKQQEALGKQQQALGERQSAASAKAEQQIEQLLEEARTKGVAQPVGQR